MFVEFAKLVFEEVIGAGLSGAFRDARSRKARLLKWAAWCSLISGMAVLQFLQFNFAADGRASTLLSWAVATAILGFFAFGLWAAIINAKVEISNGSDNAALKK